jgi:CRISPR-associated protein Cas1
VLQRHLDPTFTPWSFAFRPGLGTRDALSALASLRDEGFGWVARTDVRDCFESIDRSMLLSTLAETIPDPWLLSLVALLLERPVRARRRPQPVWRSGIAQGSPLSPILCNLYLNRFDLGMIERGHPAVRFADDITIAANSRDEAVIALAAAAEELATLKLQTGADKTGITSFDEGFFFLGDECGPVAPVDELRALAVDAVPARRSLYITRDGAWLKMQRQQFVVMHDDTEIVRIPASLVGQIVLVGAVGLSAGARSHTLMNGIDVAFVSRRGRWLGRLEGTSQSNSARRRQQYRCGDREDLRVVLARAVVTGKVHNQRQLLLRYARRSKVPHVIGAAKQLLEIAGDVPKAGSIDQVMGYEGAAAAAYFVAIGHLVPGPFEFSTRSRRPPKDPFNAALSYGYACLTNDAVSAIRLTGLDPSAGLLHGDDADRPSLALDLIEEFRPLIVDTVILDRFRRRALQPEDFGTDPQSGACLLTENGRRVVLRAYEERMLTEFHHVPSGHRTTYRRAVTLQARQIANWIADPASTYEATRWRA